MFDEVTASGSWSACTVCSVEFHIAWGVPVTIQLMLAACKPVSSPRISSVWWWKRFDMVIKSPQVQIEAQHHCHGVIVLQCKTR